MLDGGVSIASGDLDDFTTFRDCSDKLLLFINASKRGIGFNYTATENDKLIRKSIFLKEAKVDSI